MQRKLRHAKNRMLTEKVETYRNNEIGVFGIFIVVGFDEIITSWSLSFSCCELLHEQHSQHVAVKIFKTLLMRLSERTAATRRAFCLWSCEAIIQLLLISLFGPVKSCRLNLKLLLFSDRTRIIFSCEYSNVGIPRKYYGLMYCEANVKLFSNMDVELTQTCTSKV